jgi:hypothetical protein
MATCKSPPLGHLVDYSWITGYPEVILKLALTGLARLCRGPGIKSRLFRRLVKLRKDA